MFRVGYRWVSIAAISLLALTCFGQIKRSEAAKHEFEVETGFPHGRPGYVVDHINPLACGGADSPNNMQWQTVADGKAKDKWERKGCSGSAPRAVTPVPHTPARQTYVGPRGGVYHYSSSGKKVYERKKK